MGRCGAERPSLPGSSMEPWGIAPGLCFVGCLQGLAPGTPVYREKEDMYDEIMDLKKSLHMQRSDADLLRTKLRRLEEENSRKDRQIEQLLDPSRGPDFVWTLGEKRPDAGWVSVSCNRTGSLAARGRRLLSRAPACLPARLQELTEENQSLKEDLDRVLSSSPTVARTKGCVEWSKPRLLRRIAELEKKIRSLESPPPQAPDGGRSDALALCVSSTWGHRQPRPEPQEDGERQEDSERLRGALRSLKGERKALRAQLQERESGPLSSLEVRQLLQAKADVEKELEEVRRGEEARRAREAALREEIQALTRKCQDLQAAKEAEEDDPTEGTPEVQPLREAFSSHVSPELSLGGKDVARGGSSGGVLQAMRVGPQVPQSQSDRHSSHSGFSFKARLGTAFTPEGPRL
ncbi:IQ domain-containing protein E [Myotis davidii]|uniref:IQ domain-containing protein E n=1 Tax=Myotis davidii TaxID=225400 RepID=L5LSH1_MYODS|nr:IQ domain-containing protein E [Myotis davidii]